MGVSAIQEQRDTILNTIKNITRGDWKILVVDTASRKIIDNVVREDDILNENIANIVDIEDRRPVEADMDAIYLLSPEPRIVDCLMADLERRRYKKAFLVWTALLDPQMRRRIDQSNNAREQLAGFETLSIDYYPRESRLITFRDPWSFPILYHPACNGLVRNHMQLLAQKITGICVSLGEYPKVRYYRPRNPTHEASVLCTHLARFVQDELDAYAQFNADFPPPATRPQGVLLITDRSMDLVAPLLHEFTYQAMAHDLLDIQEETEEGRKVTYRTEIPGDNGPEIKDMEIVEDDTIWTEHRHKHMKDLAGGEIKRDFEKFLDEHPQFRDTEAENTNLNTIKDMMAGLPKFQKMKELYSLHLTMAAECMAVFGQNGLAPLAEIEQMLATGLTEDFKKPDKNWYMDHEFWTQFDGKESPLAYEDRFRLILLYILYRDGVIPEDVDRLLSFALLKLSEAEREGLQRNELKEIERVSKYANFATVANLDLLGGRTIKALKDTRQPAQPAFAHRNTPIPGLEDYSLARYEPAVKRMLDEAARGALDPVIFPYTKPPLDNGESEMMAAQASLRSAKPTWARNRMSTLESRQRVIVFMAGGATYSEARACYEASKSSGKDIFLATSHMLTPASFMEQTAKLSANKDMLNIPAWRPKKPAPAHLFEREAPKPQPPPPMSSGMRPSTATPGSSISRKEPPIAAMGAMNLSTSNLVPGNGHANGAPASPAVDKKGKLIKHPEEKEKKKRHFFGSKKS